MKQPRLYILVFFLDCCYIVFDWLVSNLFPHHHSIASHVPLAFLFKTLFLCEWTASRPMHVVVVFCKCMPIAIVSRVLFGIGIRHCAR